jgi:hypothetical protein
MLDIETVSSKIDTMSNDAFTEEAGAKLTSEERRLWLSFVSTVVIFGYYLVRALTIGEGHPGELLGLFISVVVLQVAVAIVGEVVMVLRGRELPQRRDERDRKIALRAARNAYYVLIGGVWCALAAALLPVGAFWYGHVLLVGFVVAELARFGSQLVYYRRGV